MLPLSLPFFRHPSSFCPFKTTYSFSPLPEVQNKLRGLRKSESQAEGNPQDARPGIMLPFAPATPKRVADA